jgi:hypothetical protein
MGGSYDFKESLTRDCQLQVFFHESVSPVPLSILLGPFRFVRKLAEIFAALCTTAISYSPMSTTPAIYYRQCCGAIVISFGSAEPLIQIAAPDPAPAPAPVQDSFIRYQKLPFLT